MAASKIVCTLATLSDSLFSGKGRGDQEAFEGLLQGVGSLEGSLCLLSQDFHPWTMVNPSSLVEGATGSVVMEADGVFHGGSGGKFLLGLSLGLCSSSARTCSSQETFGCPKGASPPPWVAAVSPSPHTSMGTISDLFGGGPFSPL